MKQKRWDPKGIDAAFLFVIFADGIYSPQSFDASEIYLQETLHPIYCQYSPRTFITQCQKHANQVKSMKDGKHVQLHDSTFKKKVFQTQKERVDTLRKLRPSYEYSNEGIRTDIDPDSEPYRWLDDSFLRSSAAAKKEPSTQMVQRKKRNDDKTEDKEIGALQADNNTHFNTILGRRILVQSYHDGRLLCWVRNDASDGLTRICIGKVTKSLVFLLRKVSEEAVDKKVMLKRHDFGTNSIHPHVIGSELSAMKERHDDYMRKLASEVDVPHGWTGKLLFNLPFEVEDHFFDKDGHPTTERRDVGKGQVFWLKKRGMVDDDDDSDIDVVIDY